MELMKIINYCDSENAKNLSFFFTHLFYEDISSCYFLQEDCIKNNITSFPDEFCDEPGGYFCGSSHTSRGDCYVVKYKNQIDGRYRYYNNKYLGGFISADYCHVSYSYYDEDLHTYYNYPYNCNFDKNIYGELEEDIGTNSFCFDSSLTPKSLNKK